MSNVFSYYAGDTFSIVASALDSDGAPATITAAAFVMSRGDTDIEITPTIDTSTATASIDEATSLTMDGVYGYAFRTKDSNGDTNTDVGIIIMTPTLITEALVIPAPQ